MRTLLSFSQDENLYFLRFQSEEKVTIDWYYSFKPDDPRALLNRLAAKQGVKTLPSWSADKIGRNLIKAFGENGRAWIDQSMVMDCFGIEYFQRCSTIGDLWKVAKGLGMLYNDAWDFDKLCLLLIDFLDVRRVLDCTFCSPFYIMQGDEEDRFHAIAGKIGMVYDIEWSLTQLGFKILGKINHLYRE